MTEGALCFSPPAPDLWDADRFKYLQVPEHKVFYSTSVPFNRPVLPSSALSHQLWPGRMTGNSVLKSPFVLAYTCILSHTKSSKVSHFSSVLPKSIALPLHCAVVYLPDKTVTAVTDCGDHALFTFESSDRYNGSYQGGAQSVWITQILVPDKYK